MMTNRRLLGLSVVLCTLATPVLAATTKAASLLFVQPNASAPAPIDNEREEVASRHALQWRVASMRDEHGQIPPNARYQENSNRRTILRGGSSTGLTTMSVSSQGSISRTTWTSRGPQNCGGRTRALVVDYTNTNVLYAGAVSGGIWKSTDAGATWTPLKDFMTNINISTLVMDPLDHNTLYAGTGEQWINPDDLDGGLLGSAYGDGLPGAGIFKTTDAGLHWDQLTATQNWQFVKQLAIQPGTTGTSAVLLSANNDGIYRSVDGGQSWSRRYIPPITNALAGVAFNPNNPNQAAALGIGVTGSSFYFLPQRSSNGGDTWLPATTIPYQILVENAALAWGPFDNVYINCGVPFTTDHTGEVWRSLDSGTNYTLASNHGETDCTAGHCSIWVSPTNANWVLVGGVYTKFSTTGATSFTQINTPQVMTNQPHHDTHWYANDPNNTNKVYVCTDGGVYRANDITQATMGGGWTSLNATYQTTQYFAGAGVTTGVGPGFGPLIGGTQDNGTLRVSLIDQNTPSFRPATNANQIKDADGGYVCIDPTDANYMYGEQQNLFVFRSTNAGETDSGVLIRNGLTSAAQNFLAPLVMDPNNHNTLLGGGAELWRTTTASAVSPSWTSIRPPISPQTNISAIAIAKTNSDIIWLGHNDGRLQKSINGLQGTPMFVNIDNNTPPSSDPLPNRMILRIMIDPGNADIVYVALGGYSANSSPSTRPNLWRTTDGGATWASIAGLPYAPIRTIVRHPRNQQQLYVGTDIGIYESQDNGLTWSTSQQGPADVAVDELSFINGSELLLAATHGRGLWTADTASVLTFGPPTNVTAAASGTTSVTVNWTAVPGATSYQVLRSSNGAAYTNAPGGAVTSSPYTDTSVQSGTTYLYRVQSIASGAPSNPSLPDLATTIAFTDDPITAQITTIKAVHLSEARTAVNAVRAAAGLTPYTFTDSAVTGVVIRALHISELRAALNDARTAIGFSTVSGSTPSMGDPIKAIDMTNVRNGVK
jgi:photosystem II stability/assembly factor-like uncharacterized protein